VLVLIKYISNMNTRRIKYYGDIHSIVSLYRRKRTYGMIDYESRMPVNRVQILPSSIDCVSGVFG
jgi:hypothetical protein